MHPFPRFGAALCIGLLALAPRAGLAKTKPQTTILTHVRLIDGTGAAPLEDETIVIRGNRITHVVQGAWPDKTGATVLDFHGDTVMPGIINAHGHLGLVEDGKNSVGAYTEKNVVSELQQYESYGVTTVLSLGLNRDLLYLIRTQQEKGKLDGATVLTADRGIGVPGGAPLIPAEDDQVYRPSTPAEARADVDEMALRKANLVKIWVDSINGTKPAMKPQIYKAVIDEAHRNHLRVAAHIYTLADAKAVVRAGVDILAHSVRDQPVDQELIRLMKHRHVWYIPTFTVDESAYIYAEHPAFMQLDFFKDSVPSSTLDMLESDSYSASIERDPKTARHKADFQMDRKNLKLLYSAGVRVGFGTDSGASPFRIPGFSEHRELEDMVDAGLSPMQAIVCATGNNAKMLGISSKRGTIKPGKRADLIVLATNPLDDISNTRHIVAIFHDGRRIQARVPVVTVR